MNELLKIIVIIFLLFSTIGCITGEDTDEQATVVHAAEKNEAVKDKVQSEPAEYDHTLVRNYEIVETEDDPSGSAIRKQYRVLVPSDVSKEELKATLIQIVMDKTSENKDIDAIAIFAYDRKEDINDAYTFGTMNLCPNGNWGDVTPEIASNNDRSSYQYKFDIKDKVGNIDTSNTPTEREYEIYDYYNDRYDKEVTKIYETNEPEKSYYSFEEITKINEEIIAAENAFITEVAHKYNISEDEAYEITIKVYVYENT